MRKLGRPAFALGLATLAALAGCGGGAKPPTLAAPPGVSFGPRHVPAGHESAKEIAGSRAAVIRFIAAMRARDPAMVAQTAVGTDAAASAQSLVRNYADRLNGSVTVTFDEEKNNQSRVACLNYPAYPYQLYLFVVKGKNGKDSRHWKVSLGNAQGPPPPIPPGDATPGPNHDKDSFCQDGFNVDQPRG